MSKDSQNLAAWSKPMKKNFATPFAMTTFECTSHLNRKAFFSANEYTKKCIFSVNIKHMKIAYASSDPQDVVHWGTLTKCYVELSICCSDPRCTARLETSNSNSWWICSLLSLYRERHRWMTLHFIAFLMIFFHPARYWSDTKAQQKIQNFI